MGHPKVKNLTPFAFEHTFGIDEEGRLQLVPIMKATYAISPGEELKLSPKQIPVNLEGERWGEPEKSSYKYEPEGTFFKPATDIVLIGHAYAPAKKATEVLVRLRVGGIEKTVRVLGDRFWVRRFGFVVKSSPTHFEKIPLLYEQAFGGWDRNHPNPKKHSFEARNPVGTGLRSWRGKFQEGVRLPNLEDPQKPLRWYRRKPPPAGFGFTSPDWQPRASYAGTYDEAWLKDRMPLLPKDFDRRFYSAASSGLVAPGYLNGDEPVVIENASARRPLRFRLPGVSNPECRVDLMGQEELVKTNLDTVIINTDDDIVLFLWRGQLPLQNSLHEVQSIQISSESFPVPVLEAVG